MKTFLVFLAVMLAGCSAYHPLKNGVGFAEIPIGASEYQVTYHGDADMSVAEARQYALTRAAELAALRGTPYFQIENERDYLLAGTDYQPGYYNTFYERYPGRRGGGRIYAQRVYSPGYIDYYTVPDIWMQIKLQGDSAGPAIPAGYILQQAQAAKVKLSPGVAELVPTLPAEPAAIPAPPQPMTRPAAPAPPPMPAPMPAPPAPAPGPAATSPTG